MPSYTFRLRTPDNLPHGPERHDLPDLNTALVLASRTARGLVRNPVRRGIRTVGGSLDVEDEANQTVARLVLREVAHQIS